MAKILHITNWYPNPWHSMEGVFVKEQFRLFSRENVTRLVNVQVRYSADFLKYLHVKYSDNECGYYIFTKAKRAVVIEALTTILLLYVIIKEKARQYDVIHFHIAYPLLVHYWLWKKVVKKKIVITEHWSAYHFNFYLPRNSKKLKRIKKIFSYKIPVITVSNALLQDIRNFSGYDNFDGHVLPNVVDISTFNYEETAASHPCPSFFMVNVWREIKNPFPMLEAFNQLHEEGMFFTLNLGGFGPLVEKMRDFVSSHSLEGVISFLGTMDNLEIAAQLHQADAYLFSSEYETFSVSCAQALCCGVPLIGPAIPAIQEYADATEMVIVENNDVSNWKITIKSFVSKIDSYDKKAISEKFTDKFSREKIMKNYTAILNAMEDKV